ncbi:hypothetical protein HNP37_004818 [Flavobacterium nitrogenifigens]|uniref:DUF6965 domain-containing protein n=2 Tax=Flavobacterium TaxID=237 RepID=A0A7W7J352_9FLAO|nr:MULTISPECIES: hypothetical protein [Flavobacterium]MBB4804720.1 hypothetical protein [Flavobacterium nitrogenifigens]MBB6389679.1 hypothetical protein [Flavobacterium notoginsengisoli]
MNPEEIKRYFESNPPPKEVQLTPWVNITDTQVFLKSCYSTVRNFTGPVDRCPAFWHLRDLYILIKKTAQKAAVEKIKETPFEEIPDETSSQAQRAD